MPPSTPPQPASRFKPHHRVAAIAVAAAVLVSIALFFLLGSQTTLVPPHHSSTPPPPPTSPEFFTTQVQPIFRDECYRCHGPLNHRGGLTLDNRAGILHGGHSGPVIVPGHPEQSLLITLIRHQGAPPDPRPMPPRRHLAPEDIATISTWIQAGAIMPQ